MKQLSIYFKDEHEQIFNDIATIATKEGRSLNYIMVLAMRQFVTQYDKHTHKTGRDNARYVL